MGYLKHNIGKLYALIVAQNALFIVPVLVPFFQSHGISLQQVFLLEGLSTLTWVIADIPTGYLADIWSRRHTLVVGSLFLCLSGIGFAVGTLFWHFCLVEIAFGIAMALNSGTVQALTYDMLAEAGDSASYRKICSHQSIAGWVSVAMAGILGGLIASWNIQLVPGLMLPFFILSVLIALTLQEPERHIMKMEQVGHLKNLKEIFSETLFHSPPLRSIILIYGLSAAMTFSLVWFTQPYQALIGIPLSYFGIAGATFMTGLTFAAKSAHFFEKRLDNRLFLILLLTITLSSFLFLGTVTPSAVGFIALFMGRCTYGAIEPLTSDMINRLTTSDRRATVLSVRSFTYNAAFTLLSPLLGYAAKAFTLEAALLMTGVGGIILAIPLTILLRQSWKQLPA